MIAKMGLSWSKISEINNINIDAIRKRYYKWAKLNVFHTAYNVLLKICHFIISIAYNKMSRKEKIKNFFFSHKNKYDLSNLFIDSLK